MAGVNLEAIEASCNDLWGAITRMRDLVITAREVDILSLTAAQKQKLKNRFIFIKGELQTAIDELEVT